MQLLGLTSCRASHTDALCARTCQHSVAVGPLARCAGVTQYARLAETAKLFELEGADGIPDALCRCAPA